MQEPVGSPGPPQGAPHSITPPPAPTAPAPPTAAGLAVIPPNPAGSVAPTVAPASSGTAAWQMPLAGLLTALGIALLIVGLLAMASSADVGAIGRSDEEQAQIDAERAAEVAAAQEAAATEQAVDVAKQDALTPPGGAGEDALTAPNGGEGQDVYADPNPSTEVPGEGGDPGFSVDCSEPGICKVESETGDELFFADDPSKLPPGTEEGDGNVLVPNPNGGIAGFKVNPDGSLELVPRGEEDFDTYGMAFGPDGSVELLKPGQKPGWGTDLLPSQPGQRQRGGPVPDLGDPATIETPNGDLTVECGQGGCRVTTEDGEELFMLDEGVGAGSGLSTEDLTADGKTLVPSPNGDIVGFRLNEDGELELVPRGEADENTMGLLFGQDGSVELLEPGAAPGLGTELIPGDPTEGLGEIPDWNPGSGDPNGAFGPGGDAAAPFTREGAPAPGAGGEGPGTQGNADPEANTNEANPNEADPNEDSNGASNDEGDTSEADNDDDDGSFFGGWTVVMGGLLMAVGLVLALLVIRRRNPKPAEAPAAETIPDERLQDDLRTDEELTALLVEAEENRKRVAAVDTLLETLRSEPNPRRAIQVAYAAVETGFGRADLARVSTESSSQYLERVLGSMTEARGPLLELTRLFELARYSNEPVDESMRTRSIDALVAVRNVYSDGTIAAGAR